MTAATLTAEAVGGADGDVGEGAVGEGEVGLAGAADDASDGGLEEGGSGGGGLGQTLGVVEGHGLLGGAADAVVVLGDGLRLPEGLRGSAVRTGEDFEVTNDLEEGRKSPYVAYIAAAQHRGRCGSEGLGC